MVKSLFYKEWIKLRWVLLGAALVTLGELAYILFSVREIIEFRSAMTAWNFLFHRHEVFYGLMQYNALTWGGTFAFAQFIFETRQRRLRLLFHLPIGPNYSLYWMIAAGLACLLAVISLTIAGLWGITLAYYPREAFTSLLWTTAPWFAASAAAYLFTVLFLLEPSWLRKALYLVIGFRVVDLFYQPGGYDVYQQALPVYLLVIAALILAPMLPAYRFKRGSY